MRSSTRNHLRFAHRRAIAAQSHALEKMTGDNEKNSSDLLGHGTQGPGHSPRSLVGKPLVSKRMNQPQKRGQRIAQRFVGATL